MRLLDSLSALISRLLKVLLCVVALIAFGTAGYCIIEGWTISDSFYMTLITISTVGYGETNELTYVGRQFTCVLIPACLITMTGWTAVLTSFMVESELNGYFSNRRTK